MKHLTAKAILAPVLSLCLLTPLFGDTFSLLFTTDDSTSTNVYESINDEEILSIVPGTSEVEKLVNDANWKVLLGDCNRDGALNDTFSEIDGLSRSPLGGGNSIYNYLLSVNASRYLTSGVKVYDGDIFRLLPGGSAEVIFPEEILMNAVSSNSDGDIDGFICTENGGLIFTFDDTVITASAQIRSSNNGSAVIDDETVFFLPAGATKASILYRADEMVAMVSNALGMDLEGIVDVQGLEMDPNHAGEILFTTGITSGPGHSTVFSSAFGGSVACLNGVPLTNAAFHFNGEEDLNSLMILSSAAVPLSLEGTKDSFSASQGGTVTLRVNGGTPGARVRIVISHAVLPVIHPIYIPRLEGTDYLYEDPKDELFKASLSIIELTLLLDDQGRGALGLPIGVLHIGKSFFLQAVETESLKASYGATIDITE